MSQSPPGETAAPLVSSKEALLKATGVSLVFAVLVLTSVVLPAEYGIDPLGTGKALGLSNLSTASGSTVIAKAAAMEGPVIDSASGYKVDAIEFTLVPGDSFEYKYQLDRNATMLFHWKASRPIEFDLHTEPDQGGAAASESFEAGTRAEGNGSYVAPYAGIHGWYWKNTDPNEIVTITLQTAGFYSAARLFAGSPKPIEMSYRTRRFRRASDYAEVLGPQFCENTTYGGPRLLKRDRSGSAVGYPRYTFGEEQEYDDSI